MKHDAAPPLDPPRLLGGGTALERQLLESARWDAAPAGARARVTAQLGPVLVETSAPPGTNPPTRGQWLRAAFTPRGTLLGLVGVGITAYLLSSLVSRPTPVPAGVSLGEPSAAFSSDSVAVASAPQLAPAPDEQPVSVAGPPVSEASRDVMQGAPVLQESAPQRRHRPPSVTSATAAAAASQRPASVDEPAAKEAPGTLLEEVRLLDTIRSALRAGELSAATRALADYERRFPRGELKNESSVLALDLLLAKGHEAPARARARELLREPGMQRYAAHLRAISEGSSVQSSSAENSSAENSSNGSDTGAAHIRARR